MNEIEILRQTLLAARASNVAALQSIDAVLRMLEPPKPEIEPEIEAETESPDAGVGDCQHDEAVVVDTAAGKFKVCHCGYQTQI